MTDIDIDEGVVGPDPETGTPVFVVAINGGLIMASPCHDMCVRAARILSEARAASYRDAMRLLRTELGMCEDGAKNAVIALHDGGEITSHGKTRH